MSDKQIEEIIRKVVAELGGVKTTKSAASVSNGCLPDIIKEDYKEQYNVPNPANGEEFMRIRRKTDARLGTWRCGSRYLTHDYLRLLADHAGALDAVQNDVPESLIEELGMFSVTTICKDKAEYLSRPDFGKVFGDEAKKVILDNCQKNVDVQILVSDGLSSTSIVENIRDLLPSIIQGLKVEGLSFNKPFFIKYGRVGAEDAVTELLNSTVTIILLGERPGLSSYESLSAYITYKGYVGIPEGKRTVVSNIHKNGTPPVEAGAHIASVVKKMIEQKASGVDLEI